VNKNNIELHLYLRLDRRQRYKREARASTSQREQYGDTVHLFIGTRRSLCKITLMPFTFTIDFRIIHWGPYSLFPFKSVPLSAAMPKLPYAWLRSFVILCVVRASHIVYGFDPSPKVPVHILRLGNIVKSCFWGPSKDEGPQHRCNARALD
jgi:hypothetical protein